MGKALAVIGILITLTAIATRADCDGLSQSDCERINQITDGMID